MREASAKSKQEIATVNQSRASTAHGCQEVKGEEEI
jgi:hypothetical protein